ncbi:Ppx/GppA phosphatase family protein [Thermocrinis minervae]|uniref:Exopolyphosphatase / guanosine-5'-triphosphate,3'-diphosphate pyrophosphatase n=1 Tax=Thermocrinis minervae TaxID=381751 RepID=A0A1M6Q280_9AQUI|nr:Ppx/GppA phosphatase family protein [Thermocrinis minervae]SHK14328.1 exopolyphosphatase / guanosine-5'-triphosphate,3'-diphosphate pyrophosphatase [Thermocrinis minervae]
MRLAVVDIGSYSCRLAVADINNGVPHIVYKEGKITSLMSGVQSEGLIQEDRMEETLQVIESYLKKAKELGVQEIYLLGTEALRKAKNRDQFFRLVKERLGLTVEVIPPEKEGELAFLSAVYSLDLSGHVCVIDQGGGSTEFVFGRDKKLYEVRSLPMGIVSLTEEFIKHDPPTIYELESLKNYVDERISELVRPVDQLVGLGGTITTLAALEYNVFPYDPSQVHGKALSLEAIMKWLEILSSMKAQERYATFPHIEPKRSKVIIAGIVMFYRILLLFGKKEIVVSDWGIKEGFLIKKGGERKGR